MTLFNYRYPIGIKKSNTLFVQETKVGAVVFKVAYGCRIFCTKICLTVAHSLKKSLIICGKFRERLKVIYIIATKTNSLRQTDIVNRTFDRY